MNSNVYVLNLVRTTQQPRAPSLLSCFSISLFFYIFYKKSCMMLITANMPNPSLGINSEAMGEWLFGS